jgi:hypothetical protein
MTECRSCRLVLPPDAYPRGDAVLPRWDGWCVRCICDHQAWGPGLAAYVLGRGGTAA